MKQNLRIAVIQHNPIVGDVAHNLQLLETQIQKHHKNCDLFVTPELALVGYSPRDLLSLPLLLKQEEDGLEKLRELSQKLGIGILVGHTEHKEGPGKTLFNVASLFENGLCVGRIRKRRIPHYDIFEEERFFESFRDTPQDPLLFRGNKLGVFICEDAWWELKRFGKDDYSYPSWGDAIKNQFAGADLLINLSASPFTLGKYKRRQDIFSKHPMENKAPLIFATCAGAQDEIIFDGPSFAMNVNGETIAECQRFCEDVFLLNWDAQNKVLSSNEKQNPRLNSWQELHSALVLGIRDYVSKTGFSKVLLGLSGGIDSALVAILAADALGPENVLGISLPTKFNSKETRSDAQLLAQNIGIEFRETPIENLVESAQALSQSPQKGLVYENLQSRSRGLFLMTCSALENRLLLATGNKSEFAMGYATLYGDMCGALAPIGDLYKTEVFGLCHWIQQTRNNPFPETILTRPPSAELAPDQKDQDSLPDYSVLDTILEEFIENQGRRWEQLQDFSTQESRFELSQIYQKLHAMEFKRFQAPPILKIHARSFGQGWRMPLAKRICL